MSKITTHKLISWMAVLVWMGLIFFLSHQPASSSSELSSGVVEIVHGIIVTLLPFIKFDLDQLHFFIRKGAHFFAYFTLGILVIHAFSFGQKITLRYIAFAFFICVLYAISDEVHQLFIPGRSGEVRDVLIDSTGAAVGIGIYGIVVSLWNRLMRRK